MDEGLSLRALARLDIASTLLLPDVVIVRTEWAEFVFVRWHGRLRITSTVASSMVE